MNFDIDPVKPKISANTMKFNSAQKLYKLLDDWKTKKLVLPIASGNPKHIHSWILSDNLDARQLGRSEEIGITRNKRSVLINDEYPTVRYCNCGRCEVLHLFTNIWLPSFKSNYGLQPLVGHQESA